MKAKDIIVGQEYAVGSEHYPERAVALEVGPISRRVHSGARWDFGGHLSTAPACRVRLLQRKNGLPGQREEVYALAKVLRPWADQAAKDEEARQRRIREAAVAEALRAKADALQAAFAALGISASTWTRDGRVEIKVGGSNMDDLLDLLRRAHEKGLARD